MTKTKTLKRTATTNIYSIWNMIRFPTRMAKCTIARRAKRLLCAINKGQQGSLSYSGCEVKNAHECHRNLLFLWMLIEEVIFCVVKQRDGSGTGVEMETTKV